MWKNKLVHIYTQGKFSSACMSVHSPQFALTALWIAKDTDR